MKEENLKSNDYYGPFSQERVVMTEELGPIISDILNKIHNTQFSNRFWEIVTAPYISAAISSRNILEQEIDNYAPPQDVYANTVIPDKKIIRYGLFRYLMKVVTTIGNHNKLCSILVKNNNLFLGFHSNCCVDNSDCDYIEAYYPLISWKKEDQKKRNIEVSTHSGYSSVFIKNIIKMLPKVYVENFEELLNMIPIYDANRKIFHVSFMENIFIRIMLAKYLENGALLYYYQHGGFYGEYKYHSAHHFEHKISDQYMTWGWKMLKRDYPGSIANLGE